MDVNTLLSRLESWAESGALRPLDLALTRFIRERTPESDPAVLLAVALTSERNGHGHVCLDLAGALEQPRALLTPRRDWLTPPPGPSAELAEWLAPLTLDEWVARLAHSGAIEDRLGIRSSPAPDTTPVTPAGLEIDETPEPEQAPLILAGQRERPLLYLRRYWAYEQRIRTGIAARLSQPLTLPEDATRTLLDRLFAEENADTPPWQRVACALAARRAFAIVTGGPGTGKTTTVVRLLALLQGLALEAGGPPLRIRLAAPTGKAAARLNESIAGQVDRLPFDRLPGGEEALRPAIPTRAGTLHRLLGTRPDSRHFRYHAGQPLPADIVVVDEASMIDVELMAALLEALRPDARLIMLGDKDQLASVEAGAVLGDLCRHAREAHYTPQTRDWLERVTGARLPQELIDPAGRPLDQAIVMLRHSYRFRDEGGIGALAELVNTGLLQGQPVRDPLAALDTLFARQSDPATRTDPSLGHIRRIRLTGEVDTQLDRLVRAGYWHGPDHAGYLAVLHEQRPPDAAAPEAFDDWARAVLKAQAGFQLLTPLRQGPWGVEGLNRRIQHLLSQGVQAPIAGADERQWFEGRPVLITRNDYALGLMNGDIGLTLRVPAQRSEGGGASMVLRVAFPAGDSTGAIRWILPSRLQAVETVFAMTVHKSQGSEFTHTALVLPDVSNPVLTRELIYTGITRSKSVFTLLYSRDSVVREALGRRVERVSGLAMALDRD